MNPIINPQESSNLPNSLGDTVMKVAVMFITYYVLMQLEKNLVNSLSSSIKLQAESPLNIPSPVAIEATQKSQVKPAPIISVKSLEETRVRRLR